jgi:mycothiol synthase
VTPENVERLTHEQLSEVLVLVKAATTVDGVAPLSEQVLLAVRDTHPASTRPAPTGPASATGSSHPGHLLAYSGTHLAGYAHLERGVAGKAATGEIVVDPSYRRQGIGTALIHALEGALTSGLTRGPAGARAAALTRGPADTSAEAHAGQAATLQFWSHGDLDGARAFAVRGGYSIVRELWQMRRSLRSDAATLPAVTLPEGFRTRHFLVGRDEEAWLRVNARAFVDHPEQGRMTRYDLDRRIAEPWFDAVGFILIEDTRGLEPVLAASHWTKVIPTGDPQARPTEGEVYVVGVDPAYQRLGLGRTVTVLGLAHLRERGLTEAMLYVDADNKAAVATYFRLDFARSAVDIMYSRIVHMSV